MGNSVTYIFGSTIIIFLFSFLLTKNNNQIVKKTFLINALTSFPLVLFGEITIFLALIFFNILIFIMGSISGFKEGEATSFQEPIIDIPISIVTLFIIGLVVIKVFQNIDYLEMMKVELDESISSEMVNFKDYLDIIFILIAVFLSMILIFKRKVFKE